MGGLGILGMVTGCGVLILAGLPVSYYLLRKEGGLVRLVSSVFMGLALISIIDYLLATLQINFIFTFYLMILLAIFSLFFILSKWGEIRRDLEDCWKELSALVSLFVVFSIMLMLPMILSGSLQRVVGVNGDYELHASLADHIAESNIYAPIDSVTSYYVPIYAYVFGYAGPKAFHIILAFLVEFSGMPAYSIYMMVSALLTSLSVFSLYLLCRKLGLSKVSSLLVTLLTMGSQGLVFFYLDNFAPQLLGFAVFPLAFVLFVDAMEKENKLLMLSCAILLSLLISSNPLPAVIFLLSAFFFFAFRLIQERKKVAGTLRLCILLFLATAVINPRSAYDYAVTTLVHVKSTGGDIYYFPPVGALFGLQSVKTLGGFKDILPQFFIVLLEVVASFAVLLGLYKSIKKRDYCLLSFACSLLVYYSGTLYMNAPYEFSKAIPFVVFGNLVLMFLYLEDSLRMTQISRKRRIARLKDGKVSAALILVILYILSMAMITLPTIYGYSVSGVMSDEFINYYKWLDANIPPNSAVYFSSVAPQSFWAVYFMKDYNVCAPQNTYVTCKKATEETFGNFEAVIMDSDMIKEENLSIKDERFPFRYAYAVNGRFNEGSFEHGGSSKWGSDVFYVFSKTEFVVAPEFSKKVCSLANTTCHGMLVSSGYQ